ncbi:hypothetical protein PT2222_210023 [Paraburkholderia tropica]
MQRKRVTARPLRSRDGFACARQCGAGCVRAHVQAFGVDEAHVGHAEEAEERLQVRRLAVVRGALILAAACRDHEHLLALDETFGAIRRVLERDAGAGDPVEVRLQLRRDAEVVKRCADHDDVRGLELGDQRFAARGDRLLFRRALIGGREERAEHGVVEVRQRIGLQVARDDLRAGVRLLQLLRQFVDEQRRLGALRAGGGIDLQDRGHGGSFGSVCAVLRE